ncbi:MAG: hypothetical protein CSB33_03680 [Desulfobacterales bacterium]|nr:MAG: hypothetical protein CSB33_03680 [Desulfobacterales bacterium]
MAETADPARALIKEEAKKLKGAARRKYIAKVTLDLLNGSPRRAEREFGWGRETVRKGLRELETRIRCVDNFSARGNKKTEEKNPELLYDIDIILNFDGRLNPGFRAYFPGGKIHPRSVRRVLVEEFEYRDQELPTETTIASMLCRLGYRLDGGRRCPRQRECK